MWPGWLRTIISTSRGSFLTFSLQAIVQHFVNTFNSKNWPMPLMCLCRVRSQLAWWLAVTFSWWTTVSLTESRRHSEAARHQRCCTDVVDSKHWLKKLENGETAAWCSPQLEYTRRETYMFPPVNKCVITPTLAFRPLRGAASRHTSYSYTHLFFIWWTDT